MYAFAAALTCCALLLVGVRAALPFPDILPGVALAAAVHVGASVYLGGLRGPRMATYLATMALLTASFAVALLTPLLDPVGQRALAPARSAASLLVPAALGLLVLDAALLQRGRRWGQRAVIASGAVAMLGSLVVAWDGWIDRATAQMLFSPVRITPETYALPSYSVLRAVPLKWGGVVAAVAVVALPAAAALFRAERLRTPPTARAWGATCGVAAGALVGLAWLGAQPPEGLTIPASRAVALIYLVSLTAVPALLHLWARRSARRTPDVFA